MKKITLELPEQKQIEINGDIFPILHSDIEVLERAVKIKEASNKLNPNDVNAVMDTIKSAIGYIDDILGEGALKKISKGKSVGIVKSIEYMTLIYTAVMEDYSDDVKDKYNIKAKKETAESVDE